MKHLTFHMVRSDLRAAPGRMLAIAALLGVACLLPSWGLGAILAFAVAGAATTGTIAAHERRSAVLAGNGCTPMTEALIAAGTILPSAVLATALAAIVGALSPPGPGLLTIVIIGLVVPIIAAPNAALALRGPVSPRTRSTDGRMVRSKRRTVLAVLGWVALGLFNPLLMLACFAYRWTTRPRQHNVVVRAIGVVFALVVIVGSATIVGSASSWDEMAILVFLFGPPTAVAVAILGINLLELIGAAAGRVGPRTRIALTPLTGRSRSLGPIVAILAVVTALAVMEPTVGASFEQREADHDETLPTQTRPAGSGPDQAIATIAPFVDPAKVRYIAGAATVDGRTRAAVIQRVGYGVADTYDGPQFLDLERAPTAWLGPNQQADAPIWVGVVEPSDLEVLGLEASADDLAAGKLVLLNPLLASVDGSVSVNTEDGDSVVLPVAQANGPLGGVKLPGGLVSKAVAERIGEPITNQAVVVAPGEQPVSREELGTDAGMIANEAWNLPDENLPTMSGDEQALHDFLSAGPDGDWDLNFGDDQVVVFKSERLNEVPFFSDTGEQGHSRLVGLGALALLVTVAGVGLALSATRVEDGVLRVQGAPTTLRAAIGATQAAVMAISASLLAVAVGIGLPAFAFSRYNAHGDLPDIPLVVPGEVWVLLVALPIVAAGLTGLLLLVTERSRAVDGVSVDDLAW